MIGFFYQSHVEWEADAENSNLIINVNHPYIPEEQRNFTFKVTLRSKMRVNCYNIMDFH